MNFSSDLDLTLVEDSKLEPETKFENNININIR